MRTSSSRGHKRGATPRKPPPLHNVAKTFWRSLISRQVCEDSRQVCAPPFVAVYALLGQLLTLAWTPLFSPSSAPTEATKLHGPVYEYIIINHQPTSRIIDEKTIKCRLTFLPASFIPPQAPPEIFRP